MTEEQHKWLLLTVRDLDAVLPNPEAAVQVTYEEDTCTFMATQEGYLRLGVEMLKAATVIPGEKDEEGVMSLDFDLTHLMGTANEFEPDNYLMVDALPPIEEVEPSVLQPFTPGRERLESFLIFAFVCFLLLALGVGIGTIVSFLLDLLH